jgi:hypothetical protein
MVDILSLSSLFCLSLICHIVWNLIFSNIVIYFVVPCVLETEYIFDINPSLPKHLVPELQYFRSTLGTMYV